MSVASVKGFILISHHNLFLQFSTVFIQIFDIFILVLISVVERKPPSLVLYSLNLLPKSDGKFYEFSPSISF